MGVAAGLKMGPRRVLGGRTCGGVAMGELRLLLVLLRVLLVGGLVVWLVGLVGLRGLRSLRTRWGLLELV